MEEASTPVTEHSGVNTMEETIQQLLEMRKQYHDKACINIQNAQERQKTQYDVKHDSNHVSNNYMYM